MKKRYWLGGILLATLLWPIGYIELGCRSDGAVAQAYRPLLTDAKDHRPEARTLLTYPEWHIVYAAESYARHLETKPPSAYRFTGDIGSFWSGLCAVNQAAEPSDAGDAKVMLYTIGISFSAEMLVKAAHENTLGRLAEWLGGWKSEDDAYATRIQRDYGAFMHETPWYAFPFGKAFSGLWNTGGGGLRHWERRFAMSLEYGIKTCYAGLIGWASGATLGQDEVTMRLVLDGDPGAIAAADARVKPIEGEVYAVPRYEQFTQIATRLAAAGINFREIAGNDDVFFTVLSPDAAKFVLRPLLSMPLGDRPGWQRRGYLVKVSTLTATLRALPEAGMTLEHVYDY